MKLDNHINKATCKAVVFSVTDGEYIVESIWRKPLEPEMQGNYDSRLYTVKEAQGGEKWLYRRHAKAVAYREQCPFIDHVDGQHFNYRTDVELEPLPAILAKLKKGE